LDAEAKKKAMEAQSPVPDLKKITADIKKFSELSAGLAKEI